MKSRTGIAITVGMLLFVVCCLWFFRHERPNDASQENGGESSPIERKPGSLTVARRFSPPLRMMPSLNQRPDSKRCPMDSPAQTLWMLTQTRSVEDVQRLYVEESREDWLERAKGKNPPYHASDQEQITAARMAMDRTLLGIMEYESLSGETVSILLLSSVSGKSKPALAFLVNRGNGWRAILNHRAHGGQDVDCLYGLLWERMQKVKPTEILRAKPLQLLADEAVKKAKAIEDKNLREVTEIPIDTGTPISILKEEAEKCRIFFLRLPKSILLPLAQERFKNVNELLLKKGQPAIKPYTGFSEFMESRKRKGK